jgi:hypothetical protein
MLQLAAGPGFPVDEFRVAAAPDGSEATATNIHFLALPKTPNPSVADSDHRLPRNGGREALIAHTRDENIQALAPRRERLNP